MVKPNRSFRIRATTTSLAATIALSVGVAYLTGIWASFRYQNIKLDFYNPNLNTSSRKILTPLVCSPLPSQVGSPWASEPQCKVKSDVGHIMDNDEDEERDERYDQYLIDIRLERELDNNDRPEDGSIATRHTVLELVNTLDLDISSEHCNVTKSFESSSCLLILQDGGHVIGHRWHVIGGWTYWIVDILLLEAIPPTMLFSAIESVFGRDWIQLSSPGPNILWALKKRGFRSGGNPDNVDIDFFPLGIKSMEWKQIIVQEETDFQNVDVIDVINARRRPDLSAYRQSLQQKHQDNYYSQHPEIFRPDRIIYLDGVLQSRLFGESAYHEALVHPAMLSHPHPKRVAIIGGGEGATLREVLKHDIETVTMIDIDEKFVKLCRKYLPEWSDCSNLIGRNNSCFDDPRAEIIFDDAVAWFTRKFGVDTKFDPNMRYDVIIMDVLDPNSHSDISDLMYSNNDFTSSLHSALNENGVLVVQTGASDSSYEVGGHLDVTGFASFIIQLKMQSFVSIEAYEESHGGFMDTWRFLIAFKNLHEKQTWGSSSPAEIDLKLKRRALLTIDGSSPFRYFDGATMASYQFPSRTSQSVACRSKPIPTHCLIGEGFDPEFPTIQLSALQVNVATNSTKSRIVANTDIVSGSYLATDDSLNNFDIGPKASAILESLADADIVNKLGPINTYIHHFGLGIDLSGEQVIGTSLLAKFFFSKHLTFNVSIADHAFNIVLRRNFRIIQTSVRTSIDVKAGTEIRL